VESKRFRSPYAVAVWWLWLLFAVGNLVDLAVQGRDRLSVVTAVVLVLITGIVWVTAQRPRLVAGADGIDIVNPLRTHRVGWPAVVKVDASELVRVRCEWPDGHRDIYAWAVRSSRRRQRAAKLREHRRASGRMGGGLGFGSAGRGGGYAAAQARQYQPPAPVLDIDHVVTELRDRADQARTAAQDSQAAAPASTWSWQAVAAVAVPAVAVLIVALA
jgi:hypothetical protein